MNSMWLHSATLRAAALLVPGGRRAEWLEEWRSELWYVPRKAATRFCLGAFQDALWLRRNDVRPMKRPALESPLRCIGFLAGVAAAGLLVSVLLPAPPLMSPAPHLRARDLLEGCIAMLLLTSLLLPATLLAMGRARGRRPPAPWGKRLRNWAFLIVKLALVQPVLLGGWVMVARMGAVPLVPLGLCASWMLAFRWVLLDQRQRCPVCLRLLTNPVRIGDPAHTFLEWYGAESVCSRGHGLLHVPEVRASYSEHSEWLRLDDSWSGLFAKSVQR